MSQKAATIQKSTTVTQKLYSTKEAQAFEQIKSTFSLQDMYDEMKNNESLFVRLYDKKIKGTKST